MLIEELKEAAKVMEAYANGKKIQCNYNCQDNEGWVDTDNPTFNWDKYVYRIKPEPEYRPFNSVKEVWDEMHKHTDFGWVHYKDPDIASDNRRVILSISEDDGNMSFVVRGLQKLILYVSQGYVEDVRIYRW